MPRQTPTIGLQSTPTQPSTTQWLTTPQPSTPQQQLSVESPQLASLLTPIGHTVPRSLFANLPDRQPEVIGLLNRISKQCIHFHKLTLQRLDALITVLSSPGEPAPSMHQPDSLINQPLSPPPPPMEHLESTVQLPEPPAPPAQVLPPPNQIDDDDEVIFQLRAKSTSGKKFAVNLVRFYFTPQELDDAIVTSNHHSSCSSVGLARKRAAALPHPGSRAGTGNLYTEGPCPTGRPLGLGVSLQL
ncbi:hypothetical protein ACROYT_G015366 [Oculina patagonica]